MINRQGSSPKQDGAQRAASINVIISRRLTGLPGS
jgi:hypothetical protein